jgi:molybdate transport system substrate-binding protein
MGRLFRYVGSIAIIALSIAMARPASGETLTIGAAYSLKPLLRDVLPLFEKQHRGLKVRVVYGPSQTQREQIEQGAPLDLFLPASFDQVRRLQAQGLTVDGPPRVYAATALVLVEAADASVIPVSFQNMTSQMVSRIAIGDPTTSAIGVLTAQLLSQVDPDDRLKGRLLYAQHSDIINLVLSGEADVGIVYRADAVNSGQVRILDAASPSMHAPVEFGGAVVWTCPAPSIAFAQDFLAFMLRPVVQDLLRKHGFDPVPTQIRPSQAYKQ